MASVEQELHFRTIIIGESGVGKSCCLFQFLEGSFSEEHNVTVGVEYGAKQLKIENRTIKLQIWDTAGQEHFRAVTRSFYRNTHGVILMYDLTKRETFDALNIWLSEVRQNAIPEVVIYLVGNMLDLANEHRQIAFEEGEEYARQNNLAGFMETSAKTAENVEEMFSQLAHYLSKQQPNTKHDSKLNTTESGQAVSLRPVTSELQQQGGNKKGGCC